MCGIAGTYSFVEAVSEQQLSSMYPGIAHRGPDGVGSFRENQIGLLHARLSIIDTSEIANQPLYNEDKSIVLICNGEIYNYKQLRQDLEARGHRFHCDSDSEVLLHLYENHRHEPGAMLRKLRGMFGFAIYDRTNKVLLVARDRFGIKPVYYSTDNTGFSFASEINSLVGIKPDLKIQIDFTSLYEYYQYLAIPEPNTIYQGVKVLPAGSYAIVTENNVSIKSWYALEDEAKPGKFSERQSFDQSLFAKIDEVLVQHLLSDVPLGSFLSAGIDSTVVTHFASLHCDASFTAISAGFPSYAEDESNEAAATAAKMKVPHHTVTLEGGFFDDVNEIASHFDQPFAVASAFSLFRISKLARKEMKVVLSGDGGDEVFGGYDFKYKPFFIPVSVQMTPLWLRGMVGGFLSSFANRKISALGEQFKLTLTDRFLNRHRVLSEDEALEWIPVNKRSEIDRNRFSRFVDLLFTKFRKFPTLHQLMAVDLSTFLKSEMLYKVDRMTMANALEGRVPFLDHELVEMAFSTQSQLLRNTEKGKLPLRDLVDKYYPGLGQRPKTGFNTPLNELLSDEASRKKIVTIISGIKSSTMINHQELDQLIMEVQQGVINAQKVMLMVCLASWLKSTGR